MILRVERHLYLWQTVATVSVLTAPAVKVPGRFGRAHEALLSSTTSLRAALGLRAWILSPPRTRHWPRRPPSSGRLFVVTDVSQPPHPAPLPRTPPATALDRLRLAGAAPLGCRRKDPVCRRALPGGDSAPAATLGAASPRPDGGDHVRSAGDASFCGRCPAWGGRTYPTMPRRGASGGDVALAQVALGAPPLASGGVSRPAPARGQDPDGIARPDPHPGLL